MTDEERDAWLAAIARAAAVRDEAAENYTRAQGRVRLLIHDANNAGVAMTEIAGAAGIHRVQAHKLYAKTKRAVV